MLNIKPKMISKFIAVIGLLIFLHYIRILAPVENFIISLLNPLAGGIYSLSSDLRLAYSEQTDKRDLIAVIYDLEEKINQLTVENARLKTVREENEKLRQYLKFITKNEPSYTLANVISRSMLISSDERDQIIIINKGRKEGLRTGLGVINSQGVIVGKIVDVKESVAKVCLTVGSNCKLAASIQNKDKTIGVVEGELGLTIKMNFIPQTEKIKIGDMVVTSGLEKDIPRGLVIGRIMLVDNNSNEVWQSATIEPLADLDALTIVSVLLP